MNPCMFMSRYEPVIHYPATQPTSRHEHSVLIDRQTIHNGVVTATVLNKVSVREFPLFYIVRRSGCHCESKGGNGGDNGGDYGGDYGGDSSVDMEED